MNHSPTRRTALLSTGAVALAVGCGSGDGDGDGSADGGSSRAVAGTAPGPELASTHDIPVGGGKIFTDQKIVVTQPEQGDFKAFSAVCPHQGCIVSDVRDGTIDCACHNSRFSVADGSVEQGPATEPLPAKRITVRGNSVHLA
ncbi:Rieske (2Fe-2S) protein [Streptomyces lancefieldiae]|uniref:Cytochrome bc1 complex Rieske iron-sulfur subunit n=1 Tax=Streptomyces lancefieldiae TaxID=3075520 RepID=A0ABU3AN74_9ACTN|nr:Rieske (2Fe-2S) protein [Streptomyces sp. DSM 40712]MDT0611418.1 Rieske (2Fe-2S) protein [Streptomyces sp. DSM 40712]